MTEIIENGDYVAENGGLKTGDYVAENGGLKTGDYTETVLQDIARAIYTEKGSFYPDPLYGSRLRFGGEEKGGIYALCCAREALCGMDGVYIESAFETETGYDFVLFINNEKRQVSVSV